MKEPCFVSSCSMYIERVKPFCSLKIYEITPAALSKNPSGKEIEASLKKEGEAVIKRMEGYTVAMCVEGKEMSSLDFARLIEKISLEKSEISFIIGGSNGLSDEVKEKADFKMSASKMTFPHRLFRVMLLEQIYRAFTINKGVEYHK